MEGTTLLVTDDIKDCLEDGITRIRTKYPEAYYEKSNHEAHLIVVPNYQLPKGYSHKTCTVLFVAPAGFPSCRPYGFWVDEADLRLQTSNFYEGWNASPHYTHNNPILGFPKWDGKVKMFLWRLQDWHYTSTLYTYLMAIKHRLDPAR